MRVTSDMTEIVVEPDRVRNQIANEPLPDSRRT
jgi:hypothetical protein